MSAPSTYFAGSAAPNESPKTPRAVPHRGGEPNPSAAIPSANVPSGNVTLGTGSPSPQPRPFQLSPSDFVFAI